MLRNFTRRHVRRSHARSQSLLSLPKRATSRRAQLRLPHRQNGRAKTMRLAKAFTNVIAILALLSCFLPGVRAQNNAPQRPAPKAKAKGRGKSKAPTAKPVSSASAAGAPAPAEPE